MTKQVKDMSASVKSKLLLKSKEQGMTFDEIMTLYMLERLLYRLSVSNYREKFVLKGGLLLCAMFGDIHRTTKDADFLARQLESQLDKMKDIFTVICSAKSDDGLIFDTDTIQTVRIKEDADYEGVRVNVLCRMGQAKKILQVDIGFGDIVIPRSKSMKYPSILNMEQPDILAYSIESVVAEKFEAMVTLAGMNSRMKDFFDIYSISRQFDIEGRVLYEAIFGTFQRRGTVYEKEIYAFTDEFKLLPDKHLQWKAFLKRSVHKELNFEDVMEKISNFVLPVFEAIIEEEEFFWKWSSSLGKWI